MAIQAFSGDSTVSGASHLLGLTSPDTELRFPVGFGLAYYLIGAVLLDFNAHKLNELASRDMDGIVESDDKLSDSIKEKASRRSALYWRTLRRYLFLHIWSLVVSATALWLFSKSHESVILFLSFIAAYTGKSLLGFPPKRKADIDEGLLWYQVRYHVLVK
jgi:hypothetical protein